MKKIRIIRTGLLILMSIILVSCASSRVADLRSLALGMSKAEVMQSIGAPDRTLSINNTNNGYQEILEFRTYYNEVYAVEFVNDRMVGYEFLYEDSPTIVTGAVIPMYPIGPHRPIYHVQPNRPTIPNRPSRPNRPTQPSRPNPSVGTTRPIDKEPINVTPPRPSTGRVADGK